VGLLRGRRLPRRVKAVLLVQLPEVGERRHRLRRLDLLGRGHPRHLRGRDGSLREGFLNVSGSCKQEIFLKIGVHRWKKGINHVIKLNLVKNKTEQRY
jgi:hypothetical protein